MHYIASENLHKNTKRIWSYIQSRKQESLWITTLKNKDGYFHIDTPTKGVLGNNQLYSQYTQEDHNNMPDKGSSLYTKMKLKELARTTQGTKAF